MDSIRIVGLQISAKHGFYEEERLKGNEFEVDVEAQLAKPYQNMSSPSDTFDYEEAANIVQQVFNGDSKLFLEELAYQIGDIIWGNYHTVLSKLTVNIRKISPPVSLSASYSEVSLCWPRSI